LIDKKAAVDK